MSFPDSEPVFTAGFIVALTTAVVAVAVAWGFPLTDEQRQAILGVVALAAPFAVALLARQHVVPVAKLESVIAEERVQAAEQARYRAS